MGGSEWIPERDVQAPLNVRQEVPCRQDLRLRLFPPEVVFKPVVVDLLFEGVNELLVLDAQSCNCLSLAGMPCIVCGVDSCVPSVGVAEGGCRQEVHVVPEPILGGRGWIFEGYLREDMPQQLVGVHIVADKAAR